MSLQRVTLTAPGREVVEGGIRRGRGAGDLVPAGRASSSAARAHALAATYFRPSAVPSVHAIASAADLSAPLRASAKRSGVEEARFWGH